MTYYKDLEYQKENYLYDFYYSESEFEDSEDEYDTITSKYQYFIEELENIRREKNIAEAAVHVLERNTGLTTLKLIYNDLGEGFGVAVASVLERNTTLMSLNLEDNLLGEVGCAAIACALERNTTLTTLNINFNGLKVSDVQL